MTFWPTHAYVPAKTKRHAEGLFDAVRDTAHAGLSPDQLAQCDAFQHGILYQQAGYFWEAHEVLETVWMVLPDPSLERRFVQGLIQIANGYLKIEMQRPKAARRLATIARNLIPADRVGAVMGIELDQTHGLIDSLDQLAINAL